MVGLVRWVMLNSLNKFKDNLARELYGMTKAEAIEKGICIDCREPAKAKCHTDAGNREYLISGLCEECYDAMFE